MGSRTSPGKPVAIAAEPDALSALAAWRGLLAELGDLGRALCGAIDAGDVQGAISATMMMRRVRTELARVEAPAAVRGELAEIRAMHDVAGLIADARCAEQVMQHWLSRQLPPAERLLASPLGVAALADSLLPAVWDFETDLVVLCGAGLEPVAELLADLGQRRIAILGGDPARQPAAAIAVETPEELNAAVRTLVPVPPLQMVLRAASGTAPEAIEAAAEAVRNALSDLRIHRNTVHAFSRRWLDQGMANLPALARWPSVAAVGDALAGKPMVIAAPGPSLAKNVELLRGLQGRAIIAAFSHSLKPVLAAGVTPDLVITVDPQDVRYHFAGCDLGDACLVSAATVHPSLFELGARRCLTMSANSAIDDWIFDGLGEEAVVAGGGSVATTAFSLALRWRCDPIIIIGLDLSFTGGQYYVSTSSDGGARACVDERGVMRVEGWSKGFHEMKAGSGFGAGPERALELPGWHGGTVPSSFMFSMFHRWFVERLKSPTNATVYNCTEGGAFIEGMIHKPLAEVLATLAGADPDHRVDPAAELDAVIAGTDGPARLARVSAHVQGFVDGLRRARVLARRARRLIRAGETGPRLERVERLLAETLEPLGFASLLAQREIERATDIAVHAGTEDGYLAASARLLETLAGVIDQLEPQLAAALARMRAEAPASAPVPPEPRSAASSGRARRCSVSGSHSGPAPESSRHG